MGGMVRGVRGKDNARNIFFFTKAPPPFCGFRFRRNKSQVLTTHYQRSVGDRFCCLERVVFFLFALAVLSLSFTTLFYSSLYLFCLGLRRLAMISTFLLCLLLLRFSSRYPLKRQKARQRLKIKKCHKIIHPLYTITYQGVPFSFTGHIMF